MRYLIDGYNLAHQLTLPAGRVSPARLAESRIELLKHLAAGHGAAASDVTVVFDCRRKRGILPEDTFEGIDVRNAQGESADDLIARLIHAHATPKKLTVVSDDRQVQTSARHRACRVLSCEDYLDELDRLRAARPLAPATTEKPLTGDPAVEAELLAAFSEPLARPRRRI